MLILAATSLLGLLTLLHVVTCVAVGYRLRKARHTRAEPTERPPITLLRPVCGLEHAIEETLRSGFALDYPDYEIIFCAPTPDDSVLPLVRRLMAEHPHVEARLLLGDERISPNPKLNNVAKGWRAAQHDFVLMADSNIDLPRDYIDRLLARWHPQMGLVSAPAIGVAPENLGGEIECAFLGTHQARWLYAAEILGSGYAQGKSLLMRRSDLDRAGGFEVLAEEIAEDSAARKAMLRIGKEVRLAFFEVPHPVGSRSFAEVWSRQVRWARLRRAAFPGHYALEILTGILPPLLLLALLIGAGLHPAWMIAFLALWYGCEAALSALAGWRLRPRSLLAFMMRDAMLPAIWIAGWTRGRYVWRGNTVDVASRRLQDTDGKTPARPPGGSSPERLRRRRAHRSVP
jgi:ceramide glucosyltransferase